jgi:hypothetical protein
MYTYYVAAYIYLLYTLYYIHASLAYFFFFFSLTARFTPGSSEKLTDSPPRDLILGVPLALSFTWPSQAYYLVYYVVYSLY